MFTKILRAAAVREPSHDELVARDHLLAVDAQVLPRFVRPASDDQAPGDEGRHVAGPAVLHRQPRQIDVGAFPDHLLAGRAAHLPRRHVPQGLEQAGEAHHFLEALGRLRLLQRGKRLAEQAQFAQVRHTHGTRHAGSRPEQVAQHRHRVADGPLEEQGRTAGTQHAVAHRRHLQVRRQGLGDAPQFTRALQLGQKIAQVAVSHG